jgi:hypothetical protein
MIKRYRVKAFVTGEIDCGDIEADSLEGAGIQAEKLVADMYPLRRVPRRILMGEEVFFVEAALAVEITRGKKC